MIQSIGNIYCIYSVSLLPFQVNHAHCIVIIREINLIIADDHQLLRDGLVKLLGKSFPDSTITGAANGKEVLSLLKDTSCDLLLLDLDMPEMDGFDTSIEVLKKYPDTRILIMSGFDDEKYIYHLIEIGVHGFITKTASPRELEEAINDIHSKGFYYNDSMVKIMRTGIIHKSTKPVFRQIVELTQREKDILKQITLEKTTKQIADKVYLSERTVEKIRANMAKKLDVKGTAGLVRYAVKNGLDI